jgi:hypothetical protein
VRRVAVAAALVAGLSLFPGAAAATPSPVAAWYVYGSWPSELASYAYARGCAFARSQPSSGLRLMLLDFGAARKLTAGTWGTVDFSDTTVSNADIVTALEAAADGYHTCHVRGSADILYGNSNYHLSGSGMSTTDAWYAGYHQSERAQDLFDYQAAKGYDSQTSDAASDMEPSWDGASITKQLVNGDAGQGWALYYDFGSADGCPQSGSSDGACNNGWRISDVGYVSFHGLALPLPEIYYTANANQWTVVRKWWNGTQGGYAFSGVTATTGAGLTPSDAWNTLGSLNSGPGRPGARVLRLLTCVAGVGVLAAGAGFAVAARTTESDIGPATPPSWVSNPIPARVLESDAPVPVSPSILRVQNGWLVSDGSTLVAVYAGSAGNDPSVGRLVIVRQDLAAGRQTVRTLDAGATGALAIAAAPLGSSVETSAQTATIGLRTAVGSALRLDLGTDTVGSG